MILHRTPWSKYVFSTKRLLVYIAIIINTESSHSWPLKTAKLTVQTGSVSVFVLWKVNKPVFAFIAFHFDRMIQCVTPITVEYSGIY